MLTASLDWNARATLTFLGYASVYVSLVRHLLKETPQKARRNARAVDHASARFTVILACSTAFPSASHDAGIVFNFITRLKRACLLVCWADPLTDSNNITVTPERLSRL